MKEAILILSAILSFAIVNGQENRDLVFDSTDLRIIERADQILADSAAWHKTDDRACEDEIARDTCSLFCPLYKASVDLSRKRTPAS